MENRIVSPQLPGFRFKPTEEELLNFYLRNLVSGKKQQFDVIGFLDIYRHDPRDLPGLAKIGEREWYFFVPRDRKPSNGGRPNRTTQQGFWKATGSDRKVFALSDPKWIIGWRKTLVFYEGRAPRGTKTDWVMNEYRLEDNRSLPKQQQDMIVLCKVYRKATSLKVLEQWAAKEEEEEYQEHQPQQCRVTTLQESTTSSYPTSPPLSSASSSDTTTAAITTCPPKENDIEDMDQEHHMYHKVEDDSNNTADQLKMLSSRSVLFPLGSAGLPLLQVPNLDWGHDLFGNSQLPSPFFDILALFTPPNYSLLNI